MEQFEPRPLIRDELAGRLLPGGVRAMVGLGRWRPIRQAMVSMSEKRIPGIWAEMLCRKRYVDDALADAVKAEVAAVVILGAGLDTRAYRLPDGVTLPVYEVDLPANIERKKALLRKTFGTVPAQVRLVPVDFDTDDLAAALANAGYPAGARTLFVWEAVTQYLTEAGVRATFDFLATAATGSRLVFTFVRKDFLDGIRMYGARLAYRDFVTKGLWKFGLCPAEVAEFLRGYGWTELDQAGPAEFAARYLDPAGRALAATEIERAVTAEKTG